MGQHQEAIAGGLGRGCPKDLVKVGERRAQKVGLGGVGMGFVLRHGDLALPHARTCGADREGVALLLDYGGPTEL